MHVETPEVLANVPARHCVHAPEVCTPIPVLNVPAIQEVQVCVPFARQPPNPPTGHGFGHARMIAGVNVSPLKLKMLVTSLAEIARE